MFEKHTASLTVFIALILALASNIPFLFGFPLDAISTKVVVAASGLLFLGLAPVFIIKKVYKEPLSNYGFRLPELSRRSKTVLSVATLLTLGQIPFLLQIPEIREFYSLPEQSLYLSLVFLGFLSLIYFFAEEFLFRGFLTFTLFRKIGLWMYPVIALLFGLLHIDKPFPEMLWAVGFSLIFSWTSIETKSFIPAAILHFLLAFLVSIAINLFYPAVTPGSLSF